MFVLFLNDMRSSNIERLVEVAKADRPELLYKFMDDCRERWRDGVWQKEFRAGSPLEWYNPPFGDGLQDGVIRIRSVEEYVEDQRKGYQQALDRIRDVHVFGVDRPL